jgi:hypothetical protein
MALVDRRNAQRVLGRFGPGIATSRARGALPAFGAECLRSLLGRRVQCEKKQRRMAAGRRETAAQEMRGQTWFG